MCGKVTKKNRDNGKLLGVFSNEHIRHNDRNGKKRAKADYFCRRDNLAKRDLARQGFGQASTCA